MSGSSEESDEDVGRFETIETAALPGFFRLVAAQLTARENFPSKKFRLRLTLACGEGDLDGLNARYRMHLRNCIVALSAEGCSYDLSDAYDFPLPDAAISEHIQQNETQKTDQEIGGGAELGVKASSFGLLGKISARGKALVSKSGSQSRKTKVKRRIMLISCNGSYWLVGDEEHGDPRNHLGRLKERYFNENSARPLCTIEMSDGVEIAEITLEVRAKFGHLDVELLNDLGQPGRPARVTDALDISDALKARLRGMAIAKILKERSARPGVQLPESEFVLTTRKLRVHMPKRRDRSDPIEQPIQSPRDDDCAETPVNGHAGKSGS